MWSRFILFLHFHPSGNILQMFNYWLYIWFPQYLLKLCLPLFSALQSLPLFSSFLLWIFTSPALPSFISLFILFSKWISWNTSHHFLLLTPLLSGWWSDSKFRGSPPSKSSCSHSQKDSFTVPQMFHAFFLYPSFYICSFLYLCSRTFLILHPLTQHIFQDTFKYHLRSNPWFLLLQLRVPSLFSHNTYSCLLAWITQ